MYASQVEACVPATFSSLSLFGGEIISLETTLVSNYSASVPGAYRFTGPSVQLTNATFCNVTVSYTHPGQNDEIYVEAWLPTNNWNERFQAVGGGGWVAGRFYLSYVGMQGALADGYATITTDAGLGSAMDASPWAHVSPGNVNLYNLQNLASVSLNDEVSKLARFVSSLLSLSRNTAVGNHWQAAHRELLWPRTSVFVLEWLLSRRPPRHDSSATLSGCL